MITKHVPNYYVHLADWEPRTNVPNLISSQRFGFHSTEMILTNMTFSFLIISQLLPAMHDG